MVTIEFCKISLVPGMGRVRIIRPITALRRHAGQAARQVGALRRRECDRFWGRGVHECHVRLRGGARQHQQCSFNVGSGRMHGGLRVPERREDQLRQGVRLQRLQTWRLLAERLLVRGERLPLGPRASVPGVHHRTREIAAVLRHDAVNRGASRLDRGESHAEGEDRTDQVRETSAYFR